MSSVDEDSIVKTLTGVTTATLTTILLKSGLRNVWIRGAFPLAPGTTRVAGRAFTVRFIPAREDLATPASWSSPKSTLNQDFAVDVKWTEEKSFDTFESAHFARQILAGTKIDRIALVTHALHMRRARLVFEQAGFRVIEAPTGFSTLRPPGILNYLPSAQGLDVSAAVFHEAIGLGWYHVRLAARGQRGQQ